MHRRPFEGQYLVDNCFLYSMGMNNHRILVIKLILESLIFFFICLLQILQFQYYIPIAKNCPVIKILWKPLLPAFQKIRSVQKLQIVIKMFATTIKAYAIAR